MLTDARSRRIEGWRRGALEFLVFGIKEARACLFAGLFFACVLLVPRAGLLGVPRYDLLLVAALAIQAWMLKSGLETRDELKAVCLFHALGFALEAFKTSSGIKSWSYPDFAYTKVLGVPLFSGFMYAAVGSYIIQAWRLLDLRVRHHPPYWMAALVAMLIYLNFFTHHALGDVRWYLAAVALGLYARTTVSFRPLDRERRMPLLLGFVLTGFFIWLAENLSTFWGLWRYPNQLGAWSAVHVSKWSSWSLLVIMTFTIVANLKHVKARIHVPEQ
ncbi:membrane protein [Massilia sp. JS1662]|nr:membrane protein [Massilia sp. JS1662]